MLTILSFLYDCVLKAASSVLQLHYSLLYVKDTSSTVAERGLALLPQKVLGSNPKLGQFSLYRFVSLYCFGFPYHSKKYEQLVVYGTRPPLTRYLESQVDFLGKQSSNNKTSISPVPHIINITLSLNNSFAVIYSICLC